MFDLKKYRGVIFHDTEEWSKFEEKLTCGLENVMGSLANFHQSTWTSQNWDFDRIFLSEVEKYMSLKFREELCVMTMKNDTESEEELICHFKIDMTNLTNFDLSTQSLQNLHFKWAPSDKRI